MSDDSKVTLTRRRALGGLITFGAVSSAVGAGTMAYFSDEGSSTNNTITAGDIELETDGNTNATTTVNVGPVAPEDSGSGTTSLNNSGSTDGHLSLEFGTPDNRNDLTEVLEVTVSVAGNVIRRGTFDTVFDGEGEWSNADIPLGSSASPKTLKFDWEVPSGAGNDIQNQEAVGDITINLNQQEEAFADLVVDQASGSGNVSTIQDGVDSIPDYAVLLVRGGTYQENVNVNKAGVKIAAKNSSSVTIEADATDDNAALRVPGFDDVTVDGLTVTHDNSVQANNSEKTGIRATNDSSNTSGPNNFTVRNCTVEDIQSKDVSSNSGGVRANGISLDLTPTGTSSPFVSASNFVVENSTVRNIKTSGDTTNAGDSRAKGISTNGDINGGAIVHSVIENIGETSQDDPNAAETADGPPFGTEKPRGIDITEGQTSGTTRKGFSDFTILETVVKGVEGLADQPAIFIGGIGGNLGNHEVYNNEFHQPLVNLSGINSGSPDPLRLRENTWVNDADGDGLPELVQSGTDPDGGNLVEVSGGSYYDTTYAI